MTGKPVIINFNTSHYRSMKQDIMTAMTIISNELNKLNKYDKEKFGQIMISGDSQLGGFLSTLLASIGIQMILNALTGKGHYNTPTGGYKTHKSKIPIPGSRQPVVKQPSEGTALIIKKWEINKKWEPYNPPPFYDQYDIKEVEGYGVKKKNTTQKRRRYPFWQFKEQPIQKRAIAEYPILKFKDDSRSNTYLQQWIDHMGVDRFAGIYACDKLTTDIISSNRNKFFISNLDYSTSNDTHWVAIYNNGKEIEYCDSYGLKPPSIIAQNYSYTYNSTQYQSYDSN